MISMCHLLCNVVIGTQENLLNGMASIPSGACRDIPYVFYWRLAAVGSIAVFFLFIVALHCIGAEVILP